MLTKSQLNDHPHKSLINSLTPDDAVRNFDGRQMAGAIGIEVTAGGLLQLTATYRQLKEVTMAKEKYTVNTYEIDFKCDVCGKGYMRPLVGTILPSWPPQYPHKCNKCGAEMNVIGHTYPYMVTERVKKVMK